MSDLTEDEIAANYLAQQIAVGSLPKQCHKCHPYAAIDSTSNC
jgi:hypothetical protein